MLSLRCCLNASSNVTGFNFVSPIFKVLAKPTFQLLLAVSKIRELHFGSVRFERAIKRHLQHFIAVIYYETAASKKCEYCILIWKMLSNITQTLNLLHRKSRKLFSFKAHLTLKLVKLKQLQMKRRILVCYFLNAVNLKDLFDLQTILYLRRCTKKNQFY